MIRTDIFGAVIVRFLYFIFKKENKKKKFKLISPLTDHIFDLIYCSLAKETDSMNTLRHGRPEFTFKAQTLRKKLRLTSVMTSTIRGLTSPSISITCTHG